MNSQSKASRIALAEWVTALDFSRHHLQALEKHTPMTLKWVLQDPVFTAWMTNKDGGILWGVGKPGAGKTTFVSFVIDYLQKCSDEDPAAVSAACYVYCSQDTSLTVKQIFESILKQLILGCPTIKLDDIQALKEQGRRPSLQYIISKLIKSAPRNVFIVIDALDECANEQCRGQVLEYLQRLIPFKILLTSPHQPSKAVTGIPPLVISARPEDVETHFQAQIPLNHTQARSVAKPSDVNAEAKIIREKADGSFLLAELYIAILAKQTNTTGFLEAKRTLPTDPSIIYRDMLQEIRQQESNRRQLAFDTISWLLYTLRPLKSIELRHALAARKLGAQSQEDDLVDEKLVISSCMGLITVNSMTSTVGFIHHTVREYLLEIAPTGDDFPSELDVARRCLEAISSPPAPNYPFLQYAASSWGPLVHRYEHNDSILDLARSHLAKPTTFELLRDVEIDNELQFHCGDYRGHCGVTAVHLIAVYGLTRTGRAFGINSSSVLINERDATGATALIWAARNGHSEVAQQLLTNPDIDVNIQDNFGQTALSWAAEMGHLHVIRVLLGAKDLNVNVVDKNGCTPLLLAAHYGYSAIVKTLLSMDNINIIAQDNYHGDTALGWAATNGHSEVAKLLVNTPSVNTRDKKYGLTPLLWAAESGKLALVTLILESGKIDLDRAVKRATVTMDVGPIIKRNADFTQIQDSGKVQFPEQHKFLPASPAQLHSKVTLIQDNLSQTNVPDSPQDSLEFGKIKTESRVFALLIAIDKYQKEDLRLYGCNLDEQKVNTWLCEKFPDSKNRYITSLTDGEATRESIIKRIKDLSDKSFRENDVVVIFFAGHGAQAQIHGSQDPSRDGKKIEILCPYDYDCEDGRCVNGIPDFQFNDLIHKVCQKTTNLTVILDCSYAESMTRPDGLRPRTVFLGPAHYVLAGYEQQMWHSYQPDAEPHCHILLAACRKGQIAYEEPDKGGHFTTKLIEYLDSLDYPITYEELEYVLSSWENQGCLQTPVCIGRDKERFLFEVQRRTYNMILTVKDAGKIHGVQEGHVLQIKHNDQEEVLFLTDADVKEFHIELPLQRLPRHVLDPLRDGTTEISVHPSLEVHFTEGRPDKVPPWIIPTDAAKGLSISISPTGDWTIHGLYGAPPLSVDAEDCDSTTILDKISHFYHHLERGRWYPADHPLKDIKLKFVPLGENGEPDLQKEQVLVAGLGNNNFCPSLPAHRYRLEVANETSIRLHFHLFLFNAGNYEILLLARSYADGGSVIKVLPSLTGIVFFKVFASKDEQDLRWMVQPPLNVSARPSRPHMPSAPKDWYTSVYRVTFAPEAGFRGASDREVEDWVRAKSKYPVTSDSDEGKGEAKTVYLPEDQISDWWDLPTPFKQPESDRTQPYDEVERWENDIY